MKDILKKSGIDTEMFSAHSTRHASTSAAARRGTNIKTILNLLPFSQNSMYNRPTKHKQSSFAQAIIGD